MNGAIMQRDMSGHVKVVAWLHIIFGAMGVLFGLFIVIFFAGIGLASDDPDAFQVLSIVGSVFAYIMIVLSIPDVICGIYILRYKEWSRILGIILAVFDLFMFPIGTAIGIYILWVLLHDDSIAIFRRS